MNIGLSLPLGYLTGANDSANARCISKALGKPATCLAELKAFGVSSIELQGFGHDASAISLQDSAQRILDAGMQLSLHGYLLSNLTDGVSGKVYPVLRPLFEVLKDRQRMTVMVVHALAVPGSSYSTILESTAQALDHLVESIQTGRYPVRVSLEINRYHGIDSPGTTYQGLLEMTERLDGTEIGFCWDMGHTQSSVMQNKLSAAPPHEFTSKVIHTHVHGIAPDGDTHRSLMESNAHIAAAITQLRSVGYDGTYNLELYPARWGVDYPVRDGILSSIRWLRTYLTSPSKV